MVVSSASHKLSYNIITYKDIFTLNVNCIKGIKVNFKTPADNVKLYMYMYIYEYHAYQSAINLDSSRPPDKILVVHHHITCNSMLVYQAPTLYY